MFNFFKNIYKRKYIIISVLVIISGLYWIALPSRLFDSPVSIVLEDRSGRLLGAMIAGDGQWRFPYEEQVPGKFAACIIAFEDKRFYAHPGIDLLAMSRAVFRNVSANDRISGASTITMQVMRMARHKQRNIFQKLIETILATRLEFSCSKKEILALYTSNAPFGGNVVGLQAASWRYFGKSATDLSWSESAVLAVLPNSPSLVHPGRNRGLLKKKRDRLLEKLKAEGEIDSLTCELAKLEPLPDKPVPLPSYNSHLLARTYLNFKKENRESNKRVRSTIDLSLQERVNKIVLRHAASLQSNGVYNLAALVLEVKTGKVLAYTGNVPNLDKEQYGGQVDMITARRSTGSILKPFLYASMIHEGSLLPEMLVPDIPTFVKNYAPKNFDFKYEGVIPANRALARSLNLPAVHMLRSYTPIRFLHQLKKMGVNSVDKPADYYGLSLILGGAEANLWDLAGVYAAMSRTLSNYNVNFLYKKNDFRAPQYIEEPLETPVLLKNAPVLNAASIWLTFEAMLKVARPDEEKFWHIFQSSRRIAWKTGTSFGDRDAWAIGCTPKYVVAVWAGNCNGEGRPGLTGVSSAAPVLFDVFDLLSKDGDWFEQPLKDMQQVMVCKQSGHVVSEICPENKEIWIPASSISSTICPYHQMAHLDTKEEWRVHSDCEAVPNMVHKPWFVLSPSEEVFYKIGHPDYKELPPYRKDCAAIFIASQNSKPMELVYPQNPTKIMVPVNLDGNLSSTVFEVAHRNSSAVIYWHIDDEFLGMTQNGMHQMKLNPVPGKHTLLLVDDTGEKVVQHFEVLEGNRAKR
jgi:penicillin-binding protein 1C